MLDIAERAPAGCEVEPNYVNMWVTPDMARAWLARNKGNRNLSMPQVDKWTAEMRAGRWLLNGHSVVTLDVNDDLIDGQHRLNAVIKYGKPVRMTVAFNAPLGARPTIDVGKKRNVAHALSMAGIPDATQAAAVLRILRALKYGAHLSNTIISSTEAVDFYMSCTGLGDSVKHVRRALGGRASVGGLGPHIAIHYIATHFLGAGSKADEYIAILAVGSNNLNCPVRAWRDRLLSMSPYSRLDQHTLMAGAVHTWNLFSEGRPAKLIRLPDVVSMPGASRIPE